MVYHLKLKTGFFKKEEVEMEVIANKLTLKTKSNKEIIIKNKDILHIDVINKYKLPELEIHTKNINYILYLNNLSQEKEIYRQLTKIFKERFEI